MATGGTDHLIRVYYLGAETPMKVSEMDAHTVRTCFFAPTLTLRSETFFFWRFLIGCLSFTVYNDV